MHQGAITDELPESYNAATTSGTANRQSSQTAIPPAYKDVEQTQYEVMRGGESNSSTDDSAVTPKGEGFTILPNEERYMSASPEVGPAISMV